MDDKSKLTSYLKRLVYSTGNLEQRAWSATIAIAMMMLEEFKEKNDQ